MLKCVSICVTVGIVSTRRLRRKLYRKVVIIEIAAAQQLTIILTVLFMDVIFSLTVVVEGTACCLPHRTEPLSNTFHSCHHATTQSVPRTKGYSTTSFD